MQLRRQTLCDAACKRGAGSRIKCNATQHHIPINVVVRLVQSVKVESAFQEIYHVCRVAVCLVLLIKTTFNALSVCSEGVLHTYNHDYTNYDLHYASVDLKSLLKTRDTLSLCESYTYRRGYAVF